MGEAQINTQVARTDYVETDSNPMYTYCEPCFIACRVDDLRHDPVGFTVPDTGFTVPQWPIANAQSS